MKSKGASDELARAAAVNALVIGQIFYLLNSRYRLDSSLSAEGASRQQVSAAGHRRGGSLAVSVHLRAAAAGSLRDRGHTAVGVAAAAAGGPGVLPGGGDGEADYPAGIGRRHERRWSVPPCTGLIFPLIWNYKTRRKDGGRQKADGRTGGRDSRTCSRPWVRSRGCASCACCSRRIRRAWWWATLGGARHSGLDAFASSGQAEERGPGQGAARKHVSAVLGEYGGAAGAAGLPLRRVLHAQQGD